MDDKSVALLGWFALITGLVGVGAWIIGEPLSMVVLIAPLAGLGGLFAVIWLKRHGF
jgi:hypothetical protein